METKARVFKNPNKGFSALSSSSRSSLPPPLSFFSRALVTLRENKGSGFLAVRPFSQDKLHVDPFRIFSPELPPFSIGREGRSRRRREKKRKKRIKEIGANRRRGRALKGFHKKRELDDEKHQNTRSVKLNVFMISQYDTTKRHLLPCENPFKGRTSYIVYDISPFVSKKQKKIS